MNHQSEIKTQAAIEWVFNMKGFLFIRIMNHKINIQSWKDFMLSVNAFHVCTRSFQESLFISTIRESIKSCNFLIKYYFHPSYISSTPCMLQLWCLKMWNFSLWPCFRFAPPSCIYKRVFCWLRSVDFKRVLCRIFQNIAWHDSHLYTFTIFIFIIKFP